MGTEGFLQRMLVSVNSWLCGCRTVLRKPRSSTRADVKTPASQPRDGSDGRLGAAFAPSLSLRKYSLPDGGPTEKTTFPLS